MVSSSSFTSSSSSPTNVKTTKFSRIQQTLFKKPNLSSSKATSLFKRQETVFKKGHELSVLCGVEVCVIYYGSDGKLKTWPEDREKVKDIARRYSETKRRKIKSVDLRKFLDKVNKEDAKKDGPKKKKKKKVIFESKVKYPTWDPRFDNYSVEQLAKLIQSLEGNLTRIQHRFSSVVEAQGQRKIQNTNLANHQELMMTIMNHPHQQYSNQVSLYLYNHGTGTLSQVPVSASSTLNQPQSLANMGNYLQETGISGFQPHNMNMFNNINGVNAFPEQIGPVSASSTLNQPQSLAPLPPALRISNMGNYLQETGISGFQPHNINGVNAFPEQIGPGLLGVQDNGFAITNMDCYRNLDKNNKVEDYLRLLGVEESTGLQNMNMYNNSSYKANGLSHQLVQYPTQPTAPTFQFGSVSV